MEANELMIDDWVYYENSPVQIKGIDSFKGEYVSFGDEFYPCKDFEPIPLTPEILEKNGFIKESRENYGNILQYCILTDGLWINISGENYFEGKLEYVHQLQHALKICGIEKEIIL